MPVSPRHLADRADPHGSRTTDRLEFAFVPCQARDNGYYPSYRHLAQDDLDLILHLGDDGEVYGHHHGP